MKRLGWIALLAGCGFQGASPGTPTPIDAGTPLADAVPGDSAMPPIDARQCFFGVGLLKDLCLSMTPDMDRTLSSAINTDGPTTCTQVFSQTGTPTPPDLCVIAGRNLTVQNTVNVTGGRALVLIAAQMLMVSSGATLDASSTTSGTARTGAGANLGACAAPANPDNSNGGGGGGAGGSLSTKGGDGGEGDHNGSKAKGGKAGAIQPAPTVLRGGCPGGKGGDGQDAGGPGGAGGGALYLIAGTSITITGDVFASGAGGIAVSNSNGVEQGGGGGGTGGMIGLDAPMVAITGRIAANGGGGGGGGGLMRGGTPGGDGTTTNWNQRAAAGGPGAGGTGVIVGGARGTAVNMIDMVDGSQADGGGGGAGGGLGFVTIYGTVTGGTQVSPAPMVH